MYIIVPTEAFCRKNEAEIYYDSFTVSETPVRRGARSVRHCSGSFQVPVLAAGVAQQLLGTNQRSEPLERRL